ncbi:MAG: hypothetical protein ABSA96_13240 [Candidatus Acidiferrales bacterium]|jgi:hypothetical protein
MLTTTQQMELIDHFFDTIRPEICKDDHNLNLIAEFIRSKTRGMEYLNRAALEWACKDLAGSLHYYQHVDISAQLQAGAEAQKQLDAANEAAERERKRIEIEATREARQQASGPGRKSAYQGAEDTTLRLQREATERQNAVMQAELHAQFVSELHRANQILITMSDGSNRVKHGATADARANAKRLLAQSYPQFASELA